MRSFIDIINENDIIDADQDSEADEREDREYQRVRRIEQVVQKMCEKELGWEFDGVSFPVNYDTAENEISITTADGEVSLADLEKLKSLGGEMRVSSTGNYRLSITIKTHPGLDISAN